MVGLIDNFKMLMDNCCLYFILIVLCLVSEKYVDWLVCVVIRIREIFFEVIFDIYGLGGEEEKIRNIINVVNIMEYIWLMGYRNFLNVY